MPTRLVVAASLVAGMGHLVSASFEQTRGPVVERLVPADQDTDQLIAQLGPMPFMVGFTNLTELVQRADAIVVGEVRRGPDLQFSTVVDGTSGKLLLRRAWAAFDLAVSTVVWSRSEPIQPEDVLSLQTIVGREEAQAVRNGAAPIAVGDECLLFLLRDDVRHTWELVSWRYQFRRTKGDDRLAERLGTPWHESARQWLEPVPVAIDASGPSVQWNALLTTVDALSAERE